MKKFLSVVLALAMLQGVSVPVFAADDEYTVERLAYMDLEQASAETKTKILEARKEIIFSQSWVADGLQGFVYDRYGNVIEEVPQFSEIFPADWEVPVFDTHEDVMNRGIGDSQILPALYDDPIMVTVFSKTLKLKLPSQYYNTPAFTSFETTYWSGHFLYDMKYVYTRGYDRESDSTYKNYFNVGYTNADTGESLGWKTNIESWDVFGISTPSNTKVAVRASMCSDNPAVTDGEWDISIYAYCDLLN